MFSSTVLRLNLVKNKFGAFISLTKINVETFASVNVRNFVTINNANLVKNHFKFVPSLCTSGSLNVRHQTNQISCPDVPAMKRSHKRYSPDLDPDNLEGKFGVVAFSTAREYNLAKLKDALIQQNLYNPQNIPDLDLTQVLITSANYKVGNEPRHMFFFQEGSVVLWNFTDLETSNVLSFLKKFEEDPYDDCTVLREKECMLYKYQLLGKKCILESTTFLISPEAENILEKYTFSNAMAQSVKLGIWEASLDNYANSIVQLTNSLQKGVPVGISRAEVLRKTGTLFALRHSINLESDLLDTPDFYWERPELEKLYLDTVSYFSITRRTRILNEKLSHCLELLGLVSSQLSDRHHVRLEWMIIILIMVEVGFEMLHFAERYLNFLTH